MANSSSSSSPIATPLQGGRPESRKARPFCFLNYSSRKKSDYEKRAFLVRGCANAAHTHTSDTLTRSSSSFKRSCKTPLTRSLNVQLKRSLNAVRHAAQTQLKRSLTQLHQEPVVTKAPLPVYVSCFLNAIGKQGRIAPRTFSTAVHSGASRAALYLVPS